MCKKTEAAPRMFPHRRTCVEGRLRATPTEPYQRSERQHASELILTGPIWSAAALNPNTGAVIWQRGGFGQLIAPAA